MNEQHSMLREVCVVSPSRFFYRAESSAVMLLQAIRTREYISRFVPLGFWTAASIGLGNIGSLYLDMGLVGALASFVYLVLPVDIAAAFQMRLHHM